MAADAILKHRKMLSLAMVREILTKCSITKQLTLSHTAPVKFEIWNIQHDGGSHLEKSENRHIGNGSNGCDEV